MKYIYESNIRALFGCVLVNIFEEYRDISCVSDPAWISVVEKIFSEEIWDISRALVAALCQGSDFFEKTI
jgi:hypothetical protein